MKNFLILTALFVCTTGVLAQSSEFKYVGAAKCKMCHNSEAAGQQHKIWSSTAHANAMKTLSSPAALEYAQKNIIAERGLNMPREPRLAQEASSGRKEVA